MWKTVVIQVRQYVIRVNPTYVGQNGASWIAPLCCGNQPHMRGEKNLLHLIHAYIVRINPTYVGKSSESKTDDYYDSESTPHAWGKAGFIDGVIFVIKNHPHIRGEKLVDNSIFISSIESTPHTWGKELIKQAKTAHKYRKIKIF